MSTIVLLLCKEILGIQYNVSVSLWVIQGSASCQNSPCFQSDDTIEVVLALWPWNSWRSVSPNTRVTLLMGWWKPSWCQHWIHSDMFIYEPRITPALFYAVTVKLRTGALCRRGWSHDINVYGLHLSDKQSCPLPYRLLLMIILCLVFLPLHSIDLLCACVCSLHCANTL